MATKITAPPAPSYLPKKQASEWQDRYTKAFSDAQTDFPEDDQTQRIYATKEANKLLRVPAPTSAAEVAKLEEHQVIDRGEKQINGVLHVYVVTADGRKYSHPKKG